MSMDKRSFFRLDVMLPCSYRVISEDEAMNNPLPLTPDASYIEKYFLEDLTQLDEQINDMIGQISQKSSILASALTAINSKINFMLETIDEKNLTQAIPQRMINVSAGGLAFEVEEEVKPSDKVDVLIKPLPDESPLLVRCNIVKIIPAKTAEGNPTIAVEYQNVTEDDRRKLVYFIQSKEIEFANQNRN